MPFLEHDGVTRELPFGDTLVGSGSEADWRLQTINLAPRHFVVRIDESGTAVLTSVRTQDVDINGEAVTAARALAHGDEIIAGAGVFSFYESLEPAVGVAGVPTARAYLIDIRGLVAYPLGDERASIGSDPTCLVVVRDSSVSRLHAEVCPAAEGPESGSGFTVRSMGAGGTSVNGSLVGGAPRTLAEGDLIRIGGATLRFTAAAPPPAARIVHRAEGTDAGHRLARPAPVRRASPDPARIATPVVRAGAPTVSGAPTGSRRTVAITVVLALAAAAAIAVAVLRVAR